MKAKITYAVDIESVPVKVQSLLKNTITTLKEAIESSETTQHLLNLNMEKSANIDCCLESINNTRLLLASVDSELSNYSDILLGYRNIADKKEEETKQKMILNEMLKKQSPAPPPQEQSDIELDTEKQLPGDFVRKMMENKNVNEG